MKDILIEVTEEDIKTGARKDCFKCPIALAINRHLKEGLESSVGRSQIHVAVANTNPVLAVSKLPQTPQDFINRFDFPCSFVSPSPFSFTLKLDESVLR